MKNIIKYLFAIIIGAGVAFMIMLSFVGPGALDWEYELPNGYEMLRINSDEIIVKHVSDSTVNIGIPSFIKEFSFDNRYVLTRNISSIQQNNIFDEEYYILDTEEQILHGPFENLTEFEAELKNLEINVQKWYRTSPDPNTINNSEVR